MTKNLQMLLAAVLLCALMWGVSSLPVTWAMPEQSGLLQTVPTRTPRSAPATEAPPPPPPATDPPPPPPTDTPMVTGTVTPVPLTPISAATATATASPEQTLRTTPTPSTATPLPTATATASANTPAPNSQVLDEATATPVAEVTPAAEVTSAPDPSDAPLPTVVAGSEEAPAAGDAQGQNVPWFWVGGLGLALLVAGAVILYMARR
jgi:hypothetical protein